MVKVRFTVFTPTYNRAHTLSRVYMSLCKQTFRNFEWLLVDDGSTDDTRLLVEKWIKQSEFPIRYFFQENQGKHVAFNKAVQLAEGELFLPLDSDDAALPCALEIFSKTWDAIPSESRAEFSAVTGVCIDEQGRVVGDRFPHSPFDSESAELRYRYRIRGEKWGFQRTDILKIIPFPEIAGENFIPEGIVWSAIGQNYKTRYINDVVRVYYADQIVGNQLTTIRSPALHAVGHALWHQTNLNDEIRWFRYAPIQFIRSAIHYVRFSYHAGSGMGTQVSKLRWPGKLLWLIAFLPGSLVFLNDRFQSKA